MRSRGLVVVLAFLLAAGATAAVFLYVKGVRDEAKTGGELTTVIVSTEPIQAGADLDTLIDQEVFTEIQVPTAAVVAGAVTSLEQLRGKSATQTILANEQIPVGRLTGGTLPGGPLSIEEGFEAITVRLASQQVVGPSITDDSHVTIYAQFDAADAKSFRGGGSAQQQGPAISGVVVPIVLDVRVLDVIRPGVAAGAQATDEDALVTLELLPRDAQKVVFAHQQGTIWLALLPPEAKVSSQAPIDFTELAKR